MSYMEKSYEETIDALLQRNRELTERLEAAERLVEKWRNVETTNRTSQIVYGWAAEELEQAIAPVAPVKPTDDETIRGRCPVAGEERTTT